VYFHPQSPRQRACSYKSQIGELHAHEADNLGRDQVVMKLQPGKRLTDTQAYKEIDNKLEEARTTCCEFYESVYTAVYLDAKNYSTKFSAGRLRWERRMFSSSSTRTRLVFFFVGVV